MAEDPVAQELVSIVAVRDGVVMQPSRFSGMSNSLPKPPDAEEAENMTDVDRRQILRESVEMHGYDRPNCG